MRFFLAQGTAVVDVNTTAKCVLQQQVWDVEQAESSSPPNFAVLEAGFQFFAEGLVAHPVLQLRGWNASLDFNPYEGFDEALYRTKAMIGELTSTYIGQPVTAD